MKKYLGSLAIWAAVLVGLTLPTLFNVGYGLFDAESWILASVCLVAATIAALLLPVGTMRCGIAIGFLVAAYLDLYVPALLKNWLVFAVVLVAILSLSAVFSKQVVAVATIAIGAGLVGAYLQVPPQITVHTARQLPHTDAPTVIHILVDEYAGDWGYPRDVISQAELDKMWSSYVNRGFLIFDRSYSLDKWTHLSVARLFNPGIDDPNKALTGLVVGDYQLNSATALNKIAQGRVLNMRGIGFVDLAPVLNKIDNVSYFADSEPMVGGPAARIMGATVADRMTVAAGISWAWLQARQRSPRVEWLTDHLDFFKRLYGARWRAVAPNAMVVARDFMQRMHSAKRGEYYFVHLLLPHDPFVLDENCNLRYWHVSDVAPGKDIVAAREDAYRHYFNQVECTQKQVFSILDAVDQNPLLHDATIFVHGDHGSRINVRNVEDWLAAGRSKDEFERDWRGAFVAVKIPGLQAGRYQRPSELTEIYDVLLASDFRHLDLGALKHSDPTLLPNNK